MQPLPGWRGTNIWRTAPDAPVRRAQRGAAHESAPAGGGARSVGGGSFSRPAAPAAVARSSGGQNFGARVPSKGNAARPPAQAIVRNAPVKESIAYPKTSIPAFVAPAKRIEPNVVRAPVVERAPTVATQPGQTGSVHPCRPSGRPARDSSSYRVGLARSRFLLGLRFFRISVLRRLTPDLRPRRN